MNMPQRLSHFQKVVLATVAVLCATLACIPSKPPPARQATAAPQQTAKKQAAPAPRPASATDVRPASPGEATRQEEAELARGGQQVHAESTKLAATIREVYKALQRTEAAEATGADATPDPQPEQPLPAAAPRSPSAKTPAAAVTRPAAGKRKGGDSTAKTPPPAAAKACS